MWVLRSRNKIAAVKLAGTHQSRSSCAGEVTQKNNICDTGRLSLSFSGRWFYSLFLCLPVWKLPANIFLIAEGDNLSSTGSLITRKADMFGLLKPGKITLSGEPGAHRTGRGRMSLQTKPTQIPRRKIWIQFVRKKSPGLDRLACPCNKTSQSQQFIKSFVLVKGSLIFNTNPHFGMHGLK